MNLSNISINGESLKALMAQQGQLIGQKVNDAVSQANSENGNPFGESVEISGPGDLMSKLQQLQEEDPEKFTEVVNDIAESLSEAASEAGDTMDGKMLSELASKMKSVAETGDISQLKPPPPPAPSSTETLADKLSAYASQNSSGSDSELALLEALLSNLSESDSDSDSGLLSSLLEALNSTSSSSSSSAVDSSDSTASEAATASSNDKADSYRSMIISAFKKLFEGSEA